MDNPIKPWMREDIVQFLGENFPIFGVECERESIRQYQDPESYIEEAKREDAYIERKHQKKEARNG